MTKTILIIAFSNLATDPRVNRQIRFLRDTYRVIAVGLAHPEVEGVEFIPVTKMKKSSPNPLAFLQILFHRYDHWYWQQKHVIDAFNKLSNVHADLILANDLQTLPLALKVAKGGQGDPGCPRVCTRGNTKMFSHGGSSSKIMRPICAESTFPRSMG